MSSSAAELRQILKEDKNGKNLYDHLTETLTKIMLDKPANAFDMFEIISSEVKANPMNPEPVVGKAVPLAAEQLEKLSKWSKSCSSLLKIPDEPPEESSVKFPDLMDEANLLEWAGVSLGKSEVYMLYLSIKSLAESLPGDVERLRLFGKITTRTLPYFVVEGISPEEEEGIDERKQENKSGANKYAYWVTQSPESKAWVKLPNVTSDQVVKARLFRRYLTGNLEALVPSYPPFPGVEKNLLRAQIAQIAGATSISPDGYFTLNEDDPPAVVMAEAEALAESFPKAASELKDIEAWKHHEIELNSIGRTLALPELLDDNGEPVEVEAVDVTPPLESAKPEAWAVRVFPGGAGSAAFSCVFARSINWPGAVSIAAGRRFLNIYVGNAVSYSAKPYSPPLPPLLQSEWAAVEEADVLLEQPDVKFDPTPPKPEGEAEEE